MRLYPSGQVSMDPFAVLPLSHCIPTCRKRRREIRTSMNCLNCLLWLMPFGHSGSAGTGADVLLCDPASTQTTRRAQRFHPRDDHHAHTSTSVPSWSCLCRQTHAALGEKYAWVELPVAES